jgi:hypothetical protein
MDPPDPPLPKLPLVKAAVGFPSKATPFAKISADEKKVSLSIRLIKTKAVRRNKK